MLRLSLLYPNQRRKKGKKRGGGERKRKKEREEEERQVVEKAVRSEIESSRFSAGNGSLHDNIDTHHT